MAKNVNIVGGGGGGVGSDELTSLLSDVVKGKTAVTSDSNDEPGTGTLELTGNAVAAHVLTGESFYTTDPKNKIVGTMMVNSILSFNVAAYSGRRVLLKWQNPYAAPGRPYCGVIIKWRSGSYPPVQGWDGTFEGVYVGVGSSTTPGGWSEVYVDMPNLNTTYYFTLTTYATTNLGHDLFSHGYGDPNSPMYATCTTAATSIIQITYTQDYVIPDGFTSADIFCVGGGGAGGIQGLSNGENGGGGGGGGYTATSLNIGITAGQVLNCSVGSGALSGRGGTTSVLRSGSILCTADGGYSAAKYVGANGGSRGGNGATYYYSNGNGNPGTNGYSDGAEGQGRTTRAFGEPGGTLYSGGGGGGGIGAVHFGPYSGGAGGGGAGGSNGTSGGKGLDNTGGGGGGSGAGYRNSAPGGSGVILIRLK